MPILLRGVTSGVDVDIDPATKAMRTTLRPLDYGTGGSFLKTSESGEMAEDLSANSPIYAFRVSSASLIAVVRRIKLRAWAILPASDFVVGLAKFDLYRAISWSVADTGGTTDVITTVNGKLRTTMASIAALAEIRRSDTAALSAGTRTLDAAPLDSLLANVADAGDSLIVAGALLDRAAGEYPLVLDDSEGFVVQATVPANLSWRWSITTEWDEVETY